MHIYGFLHICFIYSCIFVLYILAYICIFVYDELQFMVRTYKIEEQSIILWSVTTNASYLWMHGCHGDEALAEVFNWWVIWCENYCWRLTPIFKMDKCMNAPNIHILSLVSYSISHVYSIHNHTHMLSFWCHIFCHPLYPTYYKMYSTSNHFSIHVHVDR